MEKRLRYSPEALIKDFSAHLRESHPSLFPALTDIDVNIICRYQFVMLAREITAGTLRPVRLKYLGVYKVYPSRVKGIFNKLHKFRSRISNKDYDDYLHACINYLNNIGIDVDKLFEELTSPPKEDESESDTLQESPEGDIHKERGI